MGRGIARDQAGLLTKAASAQDRRRLALTLTPKAEALLAAGLALLVFYLFFGVVSGSREHHWPVLNYLQAAWLHWLMLAIVTALVLLGSIVFAAPSSNGTTIEPFRRGSGPTHSCRIHSFIA